MQRILPTLRSWLVLLSIVFCTSALAIQPLPPEEAFKVHAVSQAKPSAVQIQFDLAKGYYIYRHTIKIDQINPSVTHADLQIPTGIAHNDEFFGHFQALENQFIVTLPVKSALPSSLTISFQGCSSAGFCYPPMQRILTVMSEPLAASSKIDLLWTAIKHAQGGDFSFTPLFNQLHLSWLLLLFFMIGMLLAFTPCVLPTLPILAGMILGQKDNPTPRRSFFLALAYLTGMTFTYTLAGTVAGLAGGYWQASIQSPWISGITSVLILLFALYLFDLVKFNGLSRMSGFIHTLHLPRWQGTYFGALVLGCLVTLLISPCVTPPLIGVISFIAEKGNPWLGASALFTLGVGMSLPLLIICTLGSEWLQHFRKISQLVKHFFGWALIALAIYTATAFLPHAVITVLWGSLGLCIAIACGLFIPAPIQTWSTLLLRALGLSAFISGLYCFYLGIQTPSAMTTAASSPVSSASSSFTTVTDINALTPLLAKAQVQHLPVIIDFYADWCVACRHMEKEVFANESVITALSPYQKIRIDVSIYNQETKKLLSAYGVVAPPAVIFLDQRGKEIPNSRIVGAVSANAFLESLAKKPT